MRKRTWILMLIIIIGGCSNDTEAQNDQTKKLTKAEENVFVTKEKLSISQPNSKVKTTNEQMKNQGISTIDLLLPNENSEAREKPITHIVMHFTSNAALTPKNPYDVQEIRNTFINYGVSTHYLIGRDGQIYQMVPEERVAYHAGKGNLKQFPQYKNQLNQYSIGIEIMAIGTREEMSSMISDSIYDQIPKSFIGYTESQYQAIRHLIGDIASRNPEIKQNREHIIGHDEYAPDRKTDPGSLFDWTEIGL